MSICMHAAASAPPLPCSDLCWYAVCTNANHEKRVAQQLEARALECFLPLYSSVRRWKDRRVTLELPLFPGYVFVRIALLDRIQVLQIAGIARFVQFHGVPAALPEDEIEMLKQGMAGGLRAEPHPYVSSGRRVLIKHGPLAGLQGTVQRCKGNLRVVVSLDLIQRSISVDVDAQSVEPATWQKPTKVSVQ